VVKELYGETGHPLKHLAVYGKAILKWILGEIGWRELAACGSVQRKLAGSCQYDK
jgi:hypothetical protein